MEEDKVLEVLCDTVELCLVPVLDKNIEEELITSDHFQDFRLMLNDNLNLLLDVFHKHEIILMTEEESDSRLKKFRINFVILLCEQTSENPFFQTDQKILSNALDVVLEKWFLRLFQTYKDAIFDIYKSQLRRDIWKNHLGSIFGFVKFCQKLFQSIISLNEDHTMFILSVGSLFAEHYEVLYQTNGLKVFHLLLKNCPKKILNDFNIHLVIYDVTYKMTRKSNEIEFNQYLWECLHQYLKIEYSKDSNFAKWSKFDDVFDVLTTSLMMESNKSLSLFLLDETIKISLVDLDYNYDLIGLDEHTFSDVIETYRKLIRETPHYCTFRWSKKLMKLYVNEMSKVGGDPKDAIIHLNKIHISYLISIFCISSEILSNHLKEFVSKILILLMTVSKNYSSNKLIVKSVVEFIKSLREHVSANDDLTKLRDTLDKILENKTFNV